MANKCPKRRRRRAPAPAARRRHGARRRCVCLGPRAFIKLVADVGTAFVAGLIVRVTLGVERRAPFSQWPVASSMPARAAGASSDTCWPTLTPGAEKMGPFRPAGTPRAPLAPAPGAGRPSRVPGAGVGRLRGSRAAAGARAAGKTSKMGQIRRIWSPPGCERSCCSTRESLFWSGWSLVRLQLREKGGSGPESGQRNGF